MSQAFGQKCSYFECEHFDSNQGLRGFKFPIDDPDRCNRWICNSGNRDLLLLSSSDLKYRFLCEYHFKPEDFRKGTLKCDALPIKYSNHQTVLSQINDVSCSVSKCLDDKETASAPELPIITFDSDWEDDSSDSSDSNGLHLSKKAKVTDEKANPNLEHISEACESIDAIEDGYSNSPADKLLPTSKQKSPSTRSVLKPTTQNSWGKRKRNKKSKAGKLRHEKQFVKKMVTSMLNDILDDVVNKCECATSTVPSTNHCAMNPASEGSSVTTTNHKKVRMKTTKRGNDQRMLSDPILIVTPNTSLNSTIDKTSISHEKKKLEMREVDEERIKKYREKLQKQRLEAISEAKALQRKLTNNHTQGKDISQQVNTLPMRLDIPEVTTRTATCTSTMKPSTLKRQKAAETITTAPSPCRNKTLNRYWFRKAYQECYMTVTNLNIRSRHLSRTQKSSFGVESSASIHNSLQQALCTAINNFINISKTAKLQFIEATKITHNVSLKKGNVIIKSRRDKTKSVPVSVVPNKIRHNTSSKTVSNTSVRTTMAPVFNGHTLPSTLDSTGIFLKPSLSTRPASGNIELKTVPGTKPKVSIATTSTTLPTSLIFKNLPEGPESTKKILKQPRTYSRSDFIKVPTGYNEVVNVPKKTIASSLVCKATAGETKNAPFLKAIPLSTLQLSSMNNPAKNGVTLSKTHHQILKAPLTNVTKTAHQSNVQLKIVPSLKTVPTPQTVAPSQLQAKPQKMNTGPAHPVKNVFYAVQQGPNNTSILVPLRVANVVPVHASKKWMPKKSASVLDSIKIVEGSARTVDPMEIDEEIKVEIDGPKLSNGETFFFMDTDLDKKPSINSLIKADHEGEMVNVSGN